MPECKVVLWRWGSERQRVGRYEGYPLIEDVKVKKYLTLRAESENQLAFMVTIAAVDGWKSQNGVSK
jgi:hypothetical protein